MLWDLRRFWWNFLYVERRDVLVIESLFPGIGSWYSELLARGPGFYPFLESCFLSLSTAEGGWEATHCACNRMLAVSVLKRCHFLPLCRYHH